MQHEVELEMSFLHGTAYCQVDHLKVKKVSDTRCHSVMIYCNYYYLGFVVSQNFHRHYLGVVPDKIKEV